MENWKPTESCYGLYEVSSIGRVRQGKGGQRRNGRILKTTPNAQTGYVQRRIVLDDGSSTYALVHRLVAEAFIGPIPSGMQVNHLNGNRSDNRVENLEIVTSSENNLHAFRVLNRETPKGEKHPMAKLTEEIALEIRWLFAVGARQFQLAKEYMLDPTVIRDIVHRKRWKHI